MGVRYYFECEVEEPELIGAWPGIGNVGLTAVDTLRRIMDAVPFAEIEPWDFFYPQSVVIEDGELKDLVFPSSKFYFKRVEGKDLIFFIGEEQPGGVRKSHEMVNLVLDVALKLGCRRVYAAAAAVAPIHHTVRPKVWAVPNRNELIDEVKGYSNTILMSGIEGRGGQGSITGLNGLLLGMAKARNLPGICLLGEIPIYVSQLPILYPKASKSVLEVLTGKLGIEVDLSSLDKLAQEVERNIEIFCERMPSEIRERIDQLRDVSYLKQQKAGLLTEEDKKRIVQEVEEFFKGGDRD